MDTATAHGKAELCAVHFDRQTLRTIDWQRAADACGYASAVNSAETLGVVVRVLS